MSTEPGKVCAVVVTYNATSRLLNCVTSVIDQAGEVVIVDNGSDTETLVVIHELESHPRVKVLYNRGNLGIARALNQGVEYALQRGYRWILTLDHDSEATPGMVEKLLEGFMILGNGVGIVAANPFDRNAHAFQRLDVRGQTGCILTKRPVNSSGSLINSSLFAKVGLFNEPLFLYYVDDEFCARVRRAGFRIAIHCGATLVHSEGQRVRRRFLWRSVFYDRYSKEARYYIARNGIYMTARYPKEMCYGYVQAKRMFIDLTKTILYDDEPVAKLRYAIRGCWDAFRGRYGGLSDLASSSGRRHTAETAGRSRL